MEDRVPDHVDWAHTFKKFGRAVGRSKSKVQLARAECDKAERASKRREAKLFKDAEPQFIKQGVTAAHIMKAA